MRLATEEEKQKLFDAIKENGYKWNPEAKVLEKLSEPKFKAGDVIVSPTGNIALFSHTINSTDIVYYHCILKVFYTKDDLKIGIDCGIGRAKDCYLASNKQKEYLFDAIKANGYKWNDETKTLEKLNESKEDVTNEDVNDEIVMSGIYFDRENYADEVELHLNNYEIEIRNGKTYAIFKNKETKIPKPKFNIGDRIKEKEGDYSSGVITNIDPDYFYKVEYEEGGVSYINIKFQDKWELVPNKFDITTLKPFDRVLVRDTNGQTWNADLFSHIIDNNPNLKKIFVCAGHYADQCVPYEGNEHLLGTNNDCDEFYKTWKK